MQMRKTPVRTHEMTVVRHASATCQDWPGDRRAVVVVGRPRRAPGPPPRPRRRPRGRRLHRRRRLHRPVDRLRAAAGRPVAVASSCSSARWPASAPRGATAAGCWARSRPARASARRRGEAAIAALERAAQETVDEVGAACAREGIDCDFVKGGSLTVAQTAPQLARLRAAPRGELLDVDEAAARVRVAGLRGARFTPHCARVQPAKLARGLAAAIERHGATIYEGTAALDIAPRSVRTPLGHRARALGRARHRGLHGRRCPASSARCCRCRAR